MINPFIFFKKRSSGLPDFTTDLLAGWEFDNDFRDYKGQFELTRVDDVLLNYPGVVNTCPTFFGSEDILYLPGEKAFALTNQGNENPFSISFWYNPASFNATQGNFIISKRETNTVCEFSVNLFQGFLGISIFSLGAVADRLTARIPVNEDVGVWKHITITYDGSATFAGLKIYLNGVSQITENTSQGIYVKMNFYNSEMTIGALSLINRGYGEFDGKLDEIKIWKSRILTPSEVGILYNTELAGSSVLPVKEIPSFAGYGISRFFAPFRATDINVSESALMVQKQFSSGTQRKILQFDTKTGFVSRRSYTQDVYDGVTGVIFGDYMDDYYTSSYYWALRILYCQVTGIPLGTGGVNNQIVTTNEEFELKNGEVVFKNQGGVLSSGFGFPELDYGNDWSILVVSHSDKNTDAQGVLSTQYSSTVGRDFSLFNDRRSQKRMASVRDEITNSNFWIDYLAQQDNANSRMQTVLMDGGTKTFEGFLDTISQGTQTFPNSYLNDNFAIGREYLTAVNSLYGGISCIIIANRKWTPAERAEIELKVQQVLNL